MPIIVVRRSPKNMRIILYTGKGGVGKTSIAASTALRAADMGHRTLAMSTDVAHSLADSFDMELEAVPTRITDNLWGQEIDVLKEMQTHWSIVQDWLAALMQWQGMDEVVAEEVAVLPGMEEMVGLLNITHHYDSGEFDTIIVDCAPTGETLRLLSFPEMARWYMRKLFPIERRVATALGPMARGLFNLPVPDPKVFDSIQDLFHRLERMRSILGDPEQSSVRLVVNPEKMVIRETQRTFTYLNLYGYYTDLIVCNRLIPDSVEDGFFKMWKDSQARYFHLIEEGFAPVPIRVSHLLDREVVGLEPLREMGLTLFGEDDPTSIFYEGSTQTVTREDDGHVMTVNLPFLGRENINLMQHGDELVIQAGQHRRNIVLPRILVDLPVSVARMEGSSLKLKFEDKSPRTRRRNARTKTD